jgi:hypothetical protein
MEITQTLALPENEHAGNTFAFYLSNSNLPAVSTGPLADAMMQALDQIYERKIDATTGIALESQQLDLVKRQTWLMMRKRFAEQAGVEAPVAMIYGVQAAAASPSDLIEVAQSVGNMTDAEKADSVVIVDGAMDNTTNPAVPALESYCRDAGLKFFRSFSAFVAS